MIHNVFIGMRANVLFVKSDVQLLVVQGIKGKYISG